MKATGIVRRIDDLGRVVIPKEIRRTMRIREGDPLEIYTDHEGEVIFKKYSPIGELTSFATQYAETLYKAGELMVVITDRDSVIAASGVPKKEFLDKRLTPSFEKKIEERKLYAYNDRDAALSVTAESEGYSVRCMMPILAEGDMIGAVCSLSDKPSAPNDTELKLIRTAATFLGKQLEN